MITPLIFLICFILCLFTSVLFSGAELSIGTISRDSIEKLAESKVRGASLVLGMIGNKRRFLLMLLSGRILSISAGTLFLFLFLFPVCSKWGFSIGFPGLLTFICASLSFILTESFFAKLVSAGEYEQRVARFAYFLAFFYIVLFPVTYGADVLLSVVIKEKAELIEKEEAFMELVKSESESGVIEQEEKEMIQSIFEFSDTTVKEVMVPRIDVIAAEKNMEVDDLIELFQKEGHSRIPVYENRIDNILGVIYAKDLLIYILEKGKENFSITEIMRDAYFVPEAKKISELLKELKKTRVHIAIVIDEYGGTAGIVALEDLLEEIVGEIQDEYDQDERDYVWINDDTLVIDAGLNIDELNEIIRTEIPNEHFDTLAGFIYNQLGYIPEGGEEVKWENITFKIKEIQGNRISKVLVRLNQPGEDEKKEGE